MTPPRHNFLIRGVAGPSLASLLLHGSRDGFCFEPEGVAGMTALLDMILKVFSRRPAYAYVRVRANDPRQARGG
jgi:hypothetical protein